MATASAELHLGMLEVSDAAARDRSLAREDCLRELVALTRVAGETVGAAEVPNPLLKGIYRHFGSVAAARKAARLAPRKRLPSAADVGSNG